MSIFPPCAPKAHFYGYIQWSRTVTVTFGPGAAACRGSHRSPGTGYFKRHKRHKRHNPHEHWAFSPSEASRPSVTNPTAPSAISQRAKNPFGNKTQGRLVLLNGGTGNK